MQHPSQYLFNLPPKAQAALDEIRARNHALYGGFTMEADDGDDTGGDAGDDGKTGDSTDDKAAADDKAGADAGDDKKADDDKASDDPWADPVKAKAEIERLRRENASSRTEAKKKAADDAVNEVTQKLGKALGLIKDGDKDKVDPAELAKQAESAQSKARQAQVELALYKSASRNNADPDLLAAVLSHQGKLADLDIADAKFQDKVDAAVKKAVDDNPKLKAGQAPGSSAADHPGGSGGGGAKPKSLEEAVTKKMAS